MRWTDKLNTAQRVVVVVALGFALGIAATVRRPAAGFGSPGRSAPLSVSVSEETTRTARDVCDRRSAGRGHLLCKQGQGFESL